MDQPASHKVRFEGVVVFVLLVIFTFMLRNALPGLKPASRTPSTKTAPTKVVAAQQAAAAAPRGSGPPLKSVPEPVRAPGRVVTEYRDEHLRDPLVTPLPALTTGVVATAVPTPPSTLPARNQSEKAELEVQGLIWGGRRPLAVINGKVFEVGDNVQGGRIVAIDRHGVTLDMEGTLFKLVPQAQTSQFANHQERLERVHRYYE